MVFASGSLIGDTMAPRRGRLRGPSTKRVRLASRTHHRGEHLGNVIVRAWLPRPETPGRLSTACCCSRSCHRESPQGRAYHDHGAVNRSHGGVHPTLQPVGCDRLPVAHFVRVLRAHAQAQQELPGAEQQPARRRTCAQGRHGPGEGRRLWRGPRKKAALAWPHAARGSVAVGDRCYGQERTPIAANCGRLRSPDQQRPGWQTRTAVDLAAGSAISPVCSCRR
jgi:hypothetical protein